jgi:hypothetical protein
VRLPGQRVPGVSVLATLPGLQRFYSSFKARPHIAAYLVSDRRLPFKLPATPLFEKKSIFHPFFVMYMKNVG